MKYCQKCGKELIDEAVVCPNCGIKVDGNNLPTEKKSAGISGIILGIVGIVSAWLFALAGHITSIIAIVFGIKDCINGKKPTGLILGIIGEVCAILSSIIGAATFASLY